MTGSVQLNKGKWYCVLNMKDEEGKRKQKWISTGLAERGNKKKAQEMLSQLLVKYAGHDTITDYAGRPFAEYCDYWLKGKKGAIEDSTFQGYEIRVEHIKEFFALRKTILSKVSPRDVKEFYEYLLRDGNKARYKRNNGLSQRTIKEIALLLKAILNQAVCLGDIVSNPTEGIPIPGKRQKNLKPDIYIDENDMGVLLAEIRGHILEELIAVTLFYGLRRSEVLGLKWSAVDFEKGSLQINHTVVRVKETIEKDTTKSQASYRTYPLPEYIRTELLKIQRRQQENRKVFGDEYHLSDYVFTWPDGRPIAPDYVTKAFKKIVERCDALPSALSFHDLRKSCVSMMVEDGYSVKEIQRWIGHADAKTTLNIYAKVKESKKEHIAENMGKKFGKAI